MANYMLQWVAIKVALTMKTMKNLVLWFPLASMLFAQSASNGIKVQGYTISVAPGTGGTGGNFVLSNFTIINGAPTGLATDAAGNLYIAAYGEVNVGGD